MCDPVTMLIGAAGSLLGMGAANQQPPAPPPARLPAQVAAPTARVAGADVRIGDNAEDGSNQPDTASRRDILLRRAAGNPLGNLGRSTLRI